MSHPGIRRRGLIALAAALLAAPLALTSVSPAVASPARFAEGCGAAPSIAPGTAATVTVTSGGRERSAVVSVPQRYHSHSRTPVVLVFHGRGSTGALTREFTGASALPAIAVFPEGVEADGKQSWQGAPYAADGVDDVAFTADLLDALEASFCVDTRRVFAAGKSNGGGFVALLSCVMNDRIAAFAPVAGAYYPQSEAGCEPGDGAPVIEFHGTADATMKYAGGVSHGSHYSSVPAWLASRADRNGCSGSWTRPLTSDAEITRWWGCDGRDDLVHVAIADGGHTWPGALAYSGGGYTSTEVSATAMMWSFFQRHPLRQHR